MKFKHILPVLLALFCIGCKTIQLGEERIEINLRGHRIPAGSVEANFFNPVARDNLSRGDIRVLYYPEDDVVCLAYRHNFVSYYQFWDRANRSAFISSLEQYKIDYEARNLTTRRKMRTKRQYATERDTFLAWETTIISTFGFGWTNLEIGYQFVRNSPFFSVTQQESVNEEPETRADNYTTETVVFYFTRAQADSVAAIFDREFLVELEQTGTPARQSGLFDNFFGLFNF